MSDEFPTLEVALAASVVVLVWRGWLLHRSRLGFIAAAERLLVSFQHGPPSARQLSAANLGPFLEPLARAALTAPIDETPRAAAERASRIRRRIRSAAARDLVICAVLGGSLIYARFSGIGVARTFYLLGAAATLLLLAAVVERIRMDRALADVAARFGAALGARSGGVAPPEGRTCKVCGEPYQERLTSSADIGPRLWQLGAREIFVCTRCGHVTGKITPAQGRPGPS